VKSFNIPEHYGGLSGGYKRPIVISYLRFKITAVMQKPSERGNCLPPPVATRAAFSVMQLATKKLLEARRVKGRGS
jgi:hypothetical protein